MEQLSSVASVILESEHVLQVLPSERLDWSICHWQYVDVLLPESEVTQLCPTLCDPEDCSSPGSSIHGVLQARILEWVAISFSRGSSWLRDRTQVSRITGRRFNLWATREVPIFDSITFRYYFINVINIYNF